MSTLPQQVHPRIIQGGMGAGVSNWRLARAVSSLGQLGVISGIALDQILVRRLQDGDSGGHMRRAMNHFPDGKLAERIWNDYYIAGGKAPKRPYVALPMHTRQDARLLVELCIVGNFVEVFLAREGHSFDVGVNYLEKIQIPHLPSIYGAMLAGVGYVLMGAGIPLKIPGVLDELAEHRCASYPLTVSGAQAGDDVVMSFDPREYIQADLPPLRRPYFLAIVASNTLATTMVRKANGRVDGFVIEGDTAGGHNAPPRGALRLDSRGEPIYGERDRVNTEEIQKLERPFWLAGGFGSPEKLRQAIASGAAGVQVGTPFAFCNESGLHDDFKRELLSKVTTQTAEIRTDAVASPTGFPFKVAQLEGSASEPMVFDSRPRVCDLGYLRQQYRTPDGQIGYRCPAEPVAIYVSKGGDARDTEGKKCLCNALMANIGHAQIRSGQREEPPMITAGNDLLALSRFFCGQQQDYRAADVVAAILTDA